MLKQLIFQMRFVLFIRVNIDIKKIFYADILVKLVQMRLIDTNHYYYLSEILDIFSKYES